MSRPASAVLLASVLLVLAGCADGGSVTSPTAGAGATSPAPEAAQRFPDVRAVEATRAGDGTITLAVTISSPYDTPERYADGWRVLGPDGQELGRHELGHDHAAEQPFTRTQTGLEVPEGVDEIVVEGRDLENGYGGDTVVLEVPAS